MKQEKDSEEFIDVAIGKIRIRLPDNSESIKMAKDFINSLYDISIYSIPKNNLIIEAPIKEDLIEEGLVEENFVEPTEITKPILRPSYKKLPVMEEQREIIVEPSNESYSLCPLCNGKLKKKGIKQYGSEIRQLVVCKNRKCKFQKEYVFSL